MLASKQYIKFFSNSVNFAYLPEQAGLGLGAYMIFSPIEKIRFRVPMVM